MGEDIFAEILIGWLFSLRNNGIILQIIGTVSGCRNGGYFMNKIICDVCGTDYPETAAQCPICGCASAGAQTAAGKEMADTEEDKEIAVEDTKVTK